MLSDLVELRVSLDGFLNFKKMKIRRENSLQISSQIDLPNNQFARNSIPRGMFLSSLPLSKNYFKN